MSFLYNCYFIVVTILIWPPTVPEFNELHRDHLFRGIPEWENVLSTFIQIVLLRFSATRLVIHVGDEHAHHWLNFHENWLHVKLSDILLPVPAFWLWRASQVGNQGSGFSYLTGRLSLGPVQSVEAHHSEKHDKANTVSRWCDPKAIHLWLITSALKNQYLKTVFWYHLRKKVRIPEDRC